VLFRSITQTVYEFPTFVQTTKWSKEEKEDYVNQLVEDAVVEINAKEMNITVSDEEIQKSIKENVSDYEYYNDEQKNLIKKSTRSNLLADKVKETILGYREGRYLFFRFDKYFKENEEVFGVKDTGNLGQKQKERAQTLSKEVSQKLKSKEINFDQAIEIVNKDSLISYTAFSPARPDIYGYFDKNEAEEGINLFSYKEFQDKILAMKKGDISEPFVLQRKDVDDSMKEFAMLIVQVDEVKGDKISTYESWFNEQKQRLNVKVNSGKISFPSGIRVPEANAATCTRGGETALHKANLNIYLRTRTRANRVVRYSGINIFLYGTTGVNPYGIRPDGVFNCAGRGSAQTYTTIHTGYSNTRFAGKNWWARAVMLGGGSAGTNIYCAHVSGFQVLLPKFRRGNNNQGDLDGSRGTTAGNWRFITANAGDRGRWFYQTFSKRTSDMEKISDPYSNRGRAFKRTAYNYVNEVYNARLVLNLEHGGTSANGKVLSYGLEWLPRWKPPVQTNKAKLKIQAKYEESEAEEATEGGAGVGEGEDPIFDEGDATTPGEGETPDEREGEEVSEEEGEAPEEPESTPGTSDPDTGLNVKVTSNNSNPEKTDINGKVTPVPTPPAEWINVDLPATGTKDIDLTFENPPSGYPDYTLNRIEVVKNEESPQGFTNGDNLRFTNANKDDEFVVIAIYRRGSGAGCEVTADPDQGFEPLNVKFKAIFDPTKIPNPKFWWDFGDGQKLDDSDKISVDHTYTKSSSDIVEEFSTRLKIVSNGTEIQCKPDPLKVKVKPWSESNWLEVAP